MNTLSRSVSLGSVQSICLSIMELDLGPIKFKLMDKKDGEGWTRERADKCEVAYKRFLVLNAKFKGISIVPTKEIDTFWHYHILDTRKYFEDCDVTFGFYFHHFPYFGMRGEEDAENLNNAFAETRKLFEQEFGEAIGYRATDCANACTTPCDGGNDPSVRATDCANACTTPCDGGNDPPSTRRLGVNQENRPTVN